MSNFKLQYWPLFMLCAASALANFGYAQDDAKAAAEHEKLLATLGVEQATASGESLWKFGIRVTAHGAARGITATFPVPIEWPEQTVVEVSQDHSDNVNRMSIKRLTEEANQIVVKINQMADGEVAEATVTFRVTKASITAPADTDSLSIPARVSSKLRKYLQASPLIEIKNRTVREAADTIEFAEGLSDWEKVEQIYSWVRERVEYRFDTENRTCMHALETGLGDCGELSSLFIAMCRLKKIPARAVWIPGHTYPEFYLVDADGNGHWFPCQAAGTYTFGSMAEARPILQKGDKFKMPGSSEPTRYVKPTLVAKEVAGAPVLEWISEPVVEQE